MERYFDGAGERGRRKKYWSDLAEGQCGVCAAAASFVIVPQGAVHSFCKCRECAAALIPLPDSLSSAPAGLFKYRSQQASKVAGANARWQRQHFAVIVLFASLRPVRQRKTGFTQNICLLERTRHRQHFAGPPTHPPCTRLHN
jgi:hypothetical protein